MTKDEAYYNKKFMDPGKSGYHFKIGSKSKYQSPVPADFMINEEKGKINYVNTAAPTPLDQDRIVEDFEWKPRTRKINKGRTESF